MSAKESEDKKWTTETVDKAREGGANGKDYRTEERGKMVISTDEREEG